MTCPSGGSEPERRPLRAHGCTAGGRRNRIDSSEDYVHVTSTHPSAGRPGIARGASRCGLLVVQLIRHASGGEGAPLDGVAVDHAASVVDDVAFPESHSQAQAEAQADDSGGAASAARLVGTTSAAFVVASAYAVPQSNQLHPAGRWW